MPLRIAGLIWDDGNREKCGRHGVPSAEVEAAFSDDNLLVAPDPAHSHFEDRFVAVSRTAWGRPLFVAFTFRTVAGRRFIRPISARYMHQKEIARYEKEKKSGEGSAAEDG